MFKYISHVTCKKIAIMQKRVISKNKYNFISHIPDIQKSNRNFHSDIVNIYYCIIFETHITLKEYIYLLYIVLSDFSNRFTEYVIMEHKGE